MSRPDPRHDRSRRPAAPLHELLRGVLGVGLALVLTLPAARGHSEWLGWLPLWLVGMPAMSLLALHWLVTAAPSSAGSTLRRQPGARGGRAHPRRTRPRHVVLPHAA